MLKPADASVGADGMISDATGLCSEKKRQPSVRNSCCDEIAAHLGKNHHSNDFMDGDDE